MVGRRRTAGIVVVSRTTVGGQCACDTTTILPRTIYRTNVCVVDGVPIVVPHIRDIRLKGNA